MLYCATFYYMPKWKTVFDMSVRSVFSWTPYI